MKYVENVSTTSEIFSKPQNSGYAEFCCGNEDSDNYGMPTMYDDSCEDFEEKDD